MWSGGVSGGGSVRIGPKSRITKCEVGIILILQSILHVYELRVEKQTKRQKWLKFYGSKHWLCVRFHSTKPNGPRTIAHYWFDGVAPAELLSFSYFWCLLLSWFSFFINNDDSGPGFTFFLKNNFLINYTKIENHEGVVKKIKITVWTKQIKKTMINHFSHSFICSFYSLHAS